MHSSSVISHPFTKALFQQLQEDFFQSFRRHLTPCKASRHLSYIKPHILLLAIQLYANGDYAIAHCVPLKTGEPKPPGKDHSPTKNYSLLDSERTFTPQLLFNTAPAQYAFHAID
jgi:hypothetical protein